MIQQQATVTIDILDCRWRQTVLGTEDSISREADDLMESLILKYIYDNHIKDEAEQEYVIANASWTIDYEDSPYTAMYAVLEDEAIYGIYYSLADAEEAILAECEGEVEELMMTSYPLDVTGEEEWDWKHDYRFLVRDCAQSFRIDTVPVYGGDLEY